MSGSMAFAVPKDRQSVTIHLSQGSILTGEIFLESASAGLSIHQKVTAFLENDNVFFPIKVAAGSTTEFINKRQVQFIEVRFPAEGEAGYYTHLLMHAIPITVYFNNGEAMSGELVAEVPVEKARLSDCLNLPTTFLNLRSGSAMFYLNKEALQKVVHQDKR